MSRAQQHRAPPASSRAGVAHVVRLASLSALGLALLHCPGRSSAAATPTSWNGEFSYAGGPAESSALHSAIEFAISTLNPISRRVARARLQSATEIYPTLRIRVEADEIHVSLGTHPVVSPRDGGAIRGTSPNGTRASIRQEVRGHELVQVLHTRSGTRRNRMRLDRLGRQLSLETNISASRLPSDIHYVLTYRRTR